MRWPDFYVVGAPKCGTTAMHEYLRAHPQIYMPALKELHFFGSDLTFRFTPRISESEYRALFSGAGARERIGESSVRGPAVDARCGGDRPRLPSGLHPCHVAKPGRHDACHAFGASL